jgi:glyoxylase-like metal-dependent hydrolase (beta-lactamase superfamily II)
LDTLRGKLLMANPSPVDGLLAPGDFDLLGLRATLVPLAGHSPNQMGILVDDVFFTADVVLPIATLDKHRIPYLFSLTDHLAALDVAESVLATTYVPGHGSSLNRQDFLEISAANRAVVAEIRESILVACREPRATSDILATVLRQRDVNPTDASAYYLLQPTIAAFLTALHRDGKVEHIVRDQQSLWRTVTR